MKLSFLGYFSTESNLSKENTWDYQSFVIQFKKETMAMGPICDPHTHPDCGDSGDQGGHSVSVAGAHDGAVRADEFLLGTAEPVQLGLVLHTKLTFAREDPGLCVGGGRSRRCRSAAGGARHLGVPRWLHSSAV